MIWTNLTFWVWGKVDRFTNPIVAPPLLNNHYLLKWSLLLSNVPVHYFSCRRNWLLPPPPPIPLSICEQTQQKCVFSFLSLSLSYIFVWRVGALHAAGQCWPKVCGNISWDLCNGHCMMTWRAYPSRLRVHCKKGCHFPVPRRDVTYHALPGREKNTLIIPV